MKPCAAGDRCIIKPQLIDPQHRCPVCERHIHAIYGVTNLTSENICHSRLCYDCVARVGLIPQFTPASQTSEQSNFQLLTQLSDTTTPSPALPTDS